MSHRNSKSRNGKVLLIAFCLLAALAFGVARPISHQYRLWQARAALSNREPKQALAWLEAAERSNKEDGAVYFLMARSHRHLDAYGTAIIYLKQSHRLGYSPEALEREKLLSMAESAQLASDDPRLQGLLANPGNDTFEIFEALTKGYLRLYELGPAMLVLDNWEKGNPNDAQPRVYRGIVSEHSEDWADAEHWFRQAFKLAPNRSDIRLRLARVLRMQHHYRDAMQFYQQYLQVEENAEALHGLGACLQGEGKLQEAREAFEKGLAQSPNDYDCLLALGELDVDAGRGADALRWLAPAAKLKPREYDVRYALAMALLYSGQGDKARPHFQFAAQSRLALSQVKALRDYVGTHPDEAERRYQIGKALLDYDDTREACKWLHSALQYQPDHLAARTTLAAFYRQQGDDEAASRLQSPTDRESFHSTDQRN